MAGGMPAWTLAGTLAHVVPHLDAALVPPPALARVEAVARRLPAALASWLYLEARLGEAPAPDAPVDLIVMLDARGGDLLAGRNPALALDPALLAHPAWRAAQGFARAWRDAASPLHVGVDDAWLEFDLAAAGRDAAGDALPAPSLFVDFAPAAYGDPDRAARVRLLEAAVDGTGAMPAPAARDAIARAVHALPDDAAAVYLGLMLARAGAPARLCVSGLAGDALARWLDAIGWGGDAGAVAALVHEVGALDDGAHARPAIVHVDVGDAGVLPRLGLEYPFARRPQLEGRIAESGLLAWLAGRGLLHAAKARALAAWPGYETRTLAHELWPSILARRVNHVKLVVDDAGRWEAKGYLCAFHEPRRPRRATAGE